MVQMTRRAFGVTAIGGASALWSKAAFAEKKSLHVLLFGMPYTRGLQRLASDFEKETGIKANIEVIGQNVFENRITLSFTGRTGDIDVVHAPAIQLQKWVQAGWLEPLTKQIDSMKDTGDFLKGPFESMKAKNDMWGLPFFAEVGLMAYRADVLKAKGQSAPKTWDDMLKVAKAINTDKMAAIAMRCAPGQGFNMFVFPMIMRAYGGKFFKNYPSDLTPVINSAENLKALEIYSTLMNKYGPEGVGNFNFDQVAAAVEAGKVAIMVDGTSIVSQVVDRKKSPFADKMELALPPGGPDGRSPAIAVHGMGVPAGAPDVGASFRFIKWATSTETLIKIAIADPYPDFVRASVAKDPKVIDKYKAIQANFLQLRVEALNLASASYRPLIPSWPQIGAAVGDNVNAAVTGVKSPKAALKEAQSEMESILGQ